jgi:hypothetical protein
MTGLGRQETTHRDRRLVVASERPASVAYGDLQAA